MSISELTATWKMQTEPLEQLLRELSAVSPLASTQSLSLLAKRISRSVLINPTQPTDAVSATLKGIPGDTSPGVRLALLNIVNALCCAGAQTLTTLEAELRQHLGELVHIGPPLASRMCVAFAALMYNNSAIAEGIVPEIRANFFSRDTFPNDILGLLGYLILAARGNALPGTIHAAWYRTIADLSELYESDQLDEAALLWLGRLVHQRFGGRPVDEVAARVHADLFTDPPADVWGPEVRAFPFRETLKKGAFRVEEHLRGLGQQTLWIGSETVTGNRLLIACDRHVPHRQDLDAFRRAMSFDAPGLFKLAHIGTFDVRGNDESDDLQRSGYWATVESVPRGTWLPWVLGAADPWKAPAKAIHLGLTAGRILLEASAAGIDVSRVRPETMWADRQSDRLEITGLSPRSAELFARMSGERRSVPIYTRYYHAPERGRSPDDRTVAYTLAVMIAEWATGRYPFKSGYPADGIETADHLPFDLPRPLAELLEATIRLERRERPRLAELVEQLERL